MNGELIPYRPDRRSRERRARRGPDILERTQFRVGRWKLRRVVGRVCWREALSVLLVLSGLAWSAWVSVETLRRLIAWII